MDTRTASQHGYRTERSQHRRWRNQGEIGISFNKKYLVCSCEGHTTPTDNVKGSMTGNKYLIAECLTPQRCYDAGCLFLEVYNGKPSSGCLELVEKLLYRSTQISWQLNTRPLAHYLLVFWPLTPRRLSTGKKSDIFKRPGILYNVLRGLFGVTSFVRWLAAFTCFFVWALYAH